MIKYAALGIFALVAFLIRGVIPFVVRTTAASEPALLLLLGIGLLTLGMIARKNLPLT